MPVHATAKIVGEKELREYLEQLGREIRPSAIEAMADESVEILREYDPDTHHVYRATAYPLAPAAPGWFSDKQRRYVMSKIASGEIQIPYRRTGELQRNWRRDGSGITSRVRNYSQAAIYTMHHDRQSAHERMAGWKTAYNVIEQNIERIVNAVFAVIDKLKK
jgi:hypothetical protein